jgi:hypothetical protein
MSQAAATLHGAQRGKTRLVQHVHAGHEAAQTVLKSHAVARRGQAQQIEVAREHLQRHARAEMPARGAQHQGAGAALVIQAMHRITQGGKEGRRQRVQPFRTAQLQRGHARGVVRVKGEEIVHGRSFRRGSMDGPAWCCMQGAALGILRWFCPGSAHGYADAYAPGLRC